MENKLFKLRYYKGNYEYWYYKPTYGNSISHWGVFKSRYINDNVFGLVLN